MSNIKIQIDKTVEWLINKVTGKFLRISFGIIMIIAALRMVF